MENYIPNFRMVDYESEDIESWVEFLKDLEAQRVLQH